jgi:hypothetical protein
MPEVSLARNSGIKKPSKWERQNLPAYKPLNSGILSNLHLRLGSAHPARRQSHVAKVAGMKNESKHRSLTWRHLLGHTSIRSTQTGVDTGQLPSRLHAWSTRRMLGPTNGLQNKGTTSIIARICS